MFTSQKTFFKMFDKRALNNEIFPLKSKIGRAKVHIINSLSKKIKKFKMLLEKSPDNPKLKARHDAAVEQIQALKKVNLREAAKTAISDLSNPLDTLKNTTASLEERTLAKLYSHEFVVSAVKEIKLKHNLNDENDEWRDFVKDIGEHKKRRKDEQKKKLKDIKKKKKLISTELKKINPHKVKKLKLNVSDNPTSNSQVKNQKHADVSTSDAEETKATSDPNDGNTDLFFVTQTGENYQSTVKSALVSDSEEEPDRQTRPPKRFMKSKAAVNYQDGNSKRPFTKKYNAIDRYSNYKQNRSTNGKRDEAEQLHPSWAAKKKQKLVNFQGTKISFDESDTPKVIVRKNSFNSKPVEAEDNTLHPSWAAKMKQKTLVKEFQGQKIKFDE